jgi:hypothetical protein
MANERSVFARYAEEPKKERPEPTIPRGPMAQPEVPLVDIKSPPIERLIAWLVLRWPKPTVYSPQPQERKGLSRDLSEKWLAHPPENAPID